MIGDWQQTRCSITVSNEERPVDAVSRQSVRSFVALRNPGIQNSLIRLNKILTCTHFSKGAQYKISLFTRFENCSLSCRPNDRRKSSDESCKTQNTYQLCFHENQSVIFFTSIRPSSVVLLVNRMWPDENTQVRPLKNDTYRTSG